MAIVTILVFLPILLLVTLHSELVVPDWIKNNTEKLLFQNNLDEAHLVPILENLSDSGIIKNAMLADSQTFDVPNKGKIAFVNLSGHVNEYGKTGFVSLELTKPDGSKEILRTPILETGHYSTVFPINNQSQKGSYKVSAEFDYKQISTTYFYLMDKTNISEKIPSWSVTILRWWVENKITDKEFIQCIQYMIDKKILIVITNEPNISQLKVSVDGQHLVRRGITHTITSHVTYGDHSVEGARVTLTIEKIGQDSNEDAIREFDGFTNENGDFVFSWEIPKYFDDIETLVTYIDVTYDGSSVTKLFKFQVYCLPGEPNCKIDGNR